MIEYELHKQPRRNWKNRGFEKNLIRHPWIWERLQRVIIRVPSRTAKVKMNIVSAAWRSVGAGIVREGIACHEKTRYDPGEFIPGHPNRWPRIKGCLNLSYAPRDPLKIPKLRDLLITRRSSNGQNDISRKENQSQNQQKRK